MDEERAPQSPELQRQHQLLAELSDLIERQDRARQAVHAEHAHLRAVLAMAASRLEGMLAGERASRAELQALVETLRGAGEDVLPAPLVQDSEVN